MCQLVSLLAIPGYRRAISTSRGRHRLVFLAAITTANLLAQTVSGQAFSGTYDFSGDGNDVSSFHYNGTPIANVTPSAISKVGVTSSSSSGNFRARDWGTGSTDGAEAGGSLDTGKYFEFSITAATGYTISNPTIDFGAGRSGTGPRQFVWKSAVDSYTAAIPVTANNASVTVVSNVIQTPDADAGYTGNTVSLTTSGQTTITFRLYMFGAEGTAGTGGLEGNMTFAGTFVADLSGPQDPGSFHAAPASHQQIDLRWARNGNDNDIMVAYNTSDNFGTPTDTSCYSIEDAITSGGIVIYNGSGTSFLHSGLDANSTYYYKAWSVDADTHYSAGITANATTENLPAPSVNAATVTNTTNVTACWAQVAAANGYRLDASTNEYFVGEALTVVGWSFAADATIADAGELENTTNTLTNTGANSIVFINSTSGNRAASASGWDAGSGTKYWQVGFDASGAGQLTVHSVQRSSSAGPRDFKLQFKIGTEGVWSDVDDGAITVADNYTSGVLEDVPLPATTAAQPEVYLRWIMTSNISVEDGTVSGSGTSAMDSIQINGKRLSFVDGYQSRSVPGGATTSLAVTGLVSNTKYFYRVRATNTTSTSTNSGTQSVTTRVMPIPFSQAASVTGDTSFVANWLPVKEAEGYRLDVSTDVAFTSFQNAYENRDVGLVTSHTVTGLTAEATYYYRVRAYDTGSTSGNASTQTVITVLKPTPSSHATDFAAPTVTHRSILLTWIDAVGDTLPDVYIVRGSTNGFADIPAPSDGYTVGNIFTWNPLYARQVDFGEQQDVVTGGNEYGLVPGATYYFKLFPAANNASDRVYKTDGSVPQISVTTSTDIPFEDFEKTDGADSKGEYAAATVTLGSGAWRLADALLGAQSGDSKRDQRALRIRNLGVAEMQLDVTNAETVLLDHAHYTGDTGGRFVVERSIDNGSSWQQIGDEVVCDDTLQTATFTIHRLAAFRLRIRKTAVADDQNRINIDNIRFTPYTYEGTVIRFR